MSERTNLTKEDWIQAAQQALVKGGVDAVRVDTLAKGLRITRGSFYYHFQSRAELLDSILTSWRARATEEVIKSLNIAHRTPAEQLAQLLELPLHGQTAREAASIELGIRAWARRDNKAKVAIDEVDRHRISYIQGLLALLGVPESEAGSRAYVLYAYQMSLSLVQTEASTVVRQERNQLVMKLITSQS